MCHLTNNPKILGAILIRQNLKEYGKEVMLVEHFLNDVWDGLIIFC